MTKATLRGAIEVGLEERGIKDQAVATSVLMAVEMAFRMEKLREDVTTAPDDPPPPPAQTALPPSLAVTDSPRKLIATPTEYSREIERAPTPTPSGNLKIIPATKAKALYAEPFEWEPADLVQEIISNTPETIEFVPVGRDKPMKLNRDTLWQHALKAVKLVYRSPALNYDTAPAAPGGATMIPVHDVFVSIDCLQIGPIDFRAVMDELIEQARQVFRPRGEIANHTPPPTPMRYDRDVPQEQVNIELT